MWTLTKIGLNGYREVVLKGIEEKYKRGDAMTTFQSISDGAKSKILLVDDDAISLICLQRVLVDEGYEVATAVDVRSALKKFDAIHPDLLITDIGLPDASGMDLLREVQLKSSIPAIALSGYDASSLAEKGEFQFSGHISKPVDFNKLCALIERILSSTVTLQPPYR